MNIKLIILPLLLVMLGCSGVNDPLGSLSQTELNSRLFDAVALDRASEVQALLNAGADVENRGAKSAKTGVTTQGMTMLHLASANGFANTVKVLIEEGADIHARHQGFTPLQLAEVKNRYSTTPGVTRTIQLLKQGRISGGVLTLSGIAVIGGGMDFDFNKPLIEVKADRIFIKLKNKDNTETRVIADSVGISERGTLTVVVEDADNPRRGQTYKVTLKAGAVTGIDGTSNKKGYSREFTFGIPPRFI